MLIRLLIINLILIIIIMIIVNEGLQRVAGEEGRARPRLLAGDRWGQH